jgi:two-component system, OmpR family, sensor kinase
MFDSVRTRLTLWYVGMLALVLVVFSAGVYLLLAQRLMARTDAGLRAALDGTVKLLQFEKAEGETDQQQVESALGELHYPGQAIAFYDADGRLLGEHRVASGAQIDWLRLTGAPSEQFRLYRLSERQTGIDNGCRVAVQRVSIGSPPSIFIIAIAQPLKQLDGELELVRDILLLAVPFALLLAGVCGWLLARHSLAPVVAISHTAQRIGAENLEQRIPVINPRDELGKLAATFNDLLGRIGAAFSQQRQFMADASHELRTPIHVVRTAVEVTLEQPRRDEGEYRDTLKVIGDQARRLSRIVEDMFTLARADAGRLPLRRSSFYLDELLAETARAATVLAVPKGVSVELPPAPETPFAGDEDLLRQMLLNLLDNAIKHTPAGGKVRLGLTQKGAQYLIEVADTGAGIPVEAQAQIFERFYRVDKARARAESGNGAGSSAGLGLAIARWVAEAHGGAIKLVRSDPTGTLFVIALPLPQ